MTKSKLFIIAIMQVLSISCSDVGTDESVVDMHRVRRVPRVNSSSTLQKETEEYFKQILLIDAKIVDSAQNSDTEQSNFGPLQRECRLSLASSKEELDKEVKEYFERHEKIEIPFIEDFSDDEFA